MLESVPAFFFILTLLNNKIDSFHDFSHVAVYNLTTNSWKYLEDFEMRYDYMAEEHMMIASLYSKCSESRHILLTFGRWKEGGCRLT